MVDTAAAPRPRIALVGGDEADVVALRNALGASVEVADAGAAAAFDIERIRGLDVAAVLVGLDGGDWLEPLADRVEEAGIPLVFDDPSISCTLEGWAHARWLRHLVAKLGGSRDYDPPRPTDAATATATSGATAVDGAAAAVGAAETGAAIAGAIATGPLSAGRIAMPTAGSVDVPEEPPESAPAVREAAVASAVPAAAADGIEQLARSIGVLPAPAVTLALRKEEDMVESSEGMHGAAQEAKPQAGSEEVATGVGGAPVAVDIPAVEASTSADGDGDSLDLDPDMAALSALIDRRLAGAAGGPAGSLGALPADPASTIDVGHPTDIVAVDASAIEGGAGARRRPHPVSDPVDEAEVLKGLPSVDDWQLVDPAAPAPNATPAAPAAPAAIDVAGLELVPMEEVAAIERHSDPIERWMDTAERVTAAADAARRRVPGKGRSGA